MRSESSVGRFVAGLGRGRRGVVGAEREPSVGRFVAGLVGLFVCTSLVWMAVWAMAAAFVYGSFPVSVGSGSMAPALDTGDLVVVEPYHGQSLRRGSVVVFDDPAGSRSVIHRVVELHGDGSFTTKGDANASADSTPIRPEHVTSVGRYLLPRIGLPVVWWQRGEWWAAALALVVIGGSFWLARFAVFDAHDPWLAGTARLPWERRRAVELVRAGWSTLVVRRATIGLRTAALASVKRRWVELAGVGLALVFLQTTVTAYGAFAATTTNGTSTLSAGTLAPPSGFDADPGSCSGGATINFAGSASASADPSSGGVDLPLPASADAGDLLLAQVAMHTHDFIVQPGYSNLLDGPSGWTLIREDFDGDHMAQALYYRVATGTEPGTYHWHNGSGDSSREIGGTIVAYSGVDTSAPIDDHDATVYSSNVSSFTAPSVVATADNARLVVAVTQRTDGPITPDAAMTERSEITEGGRLVAELADEVLTSPGATGTRTATSGGTQTGVIQSLVLSPGGVEEADLSWTATPSGYADGYELQRWIGGTLDATFSITPASASSFTDSGLVAGTTYTYRLRATSGDWRSSPVTTTFTPDTC